MNMKRRCVELESLHQDLSAFAQTLPRHDPSCLRHSSDGLAKDCNLLLKRRDRACEIHTEGNDDNGPRHQEDAWAKQLAGAVLVYMILQYGLSKLCVFQQAAGSKLTAINLGRLFTPSFLHPSENRIHTS